MTRFSEFSRFTRLAALAGALVGLASTTFAQVPGVITYQGHLTAGGTNIVGPGYFKFALVGPPTPDVISYWSHDLSSVGGGMPVGSLPLPLADGNFTVLLGDTAGNGSAAIPATVFNHPDVRLRIWISQDDASFTQLTPDQRLTAGGYALRAAGTTDGAITPGMLAPAAVNTPALADGSVSEAKLADGAVNGAKLTPGSIKTAHLADGAVATAKLAAAAVTTDRLADGAVTEPKLAGGAVSSAKLGLGSVKSAHLVDGVVGTAKLEVAAVTTDKLADGSVTSVKLAAGSVGSAQLADDATFRTLSLGGPSWDGTLNLYGKPVGGGGIVNPAGVLRGRVTADAFGGTLDLMDAAGNPTLELGTQGGAPHLSLIQPDGDTYAFMGAAAGAGLLRLHQLDGKPGVLLDGDKATPDNGSNAGGEITVYQRNGLAGLLLDGDHESAGRIELRQGNGLTYVDLFGRGEADGGEVRVKDNDGTTTVELRGRAGNSQAGQIRLFGATGHTNVVLKAQAGASQGASLTLGGFDGRPLAVLDAQATDASGAELHLYRNNGVRTVELDAQWDSNGESKASVLRLLNRSSEPRVTLEAENSANAGRVSIRNSDNIQTVEMVGAGADAGGQVYLNRSNGDKGIELDAQAGSGGGWIGLYKAGETAASIVLNASAAGGARVTTQVLEITGGSDLSEQFQVADAATGLEPEPGMVVCIDPDVPGRLIPCARDCDPAVAGVISGAGGIRTGMLMGQRGSVADGLHPVALTGRVYCRVDASGGAVKPGDLLTTSTTPGHARKLLPGESANGAILGKAMSPLASGRGLVLVLVSLQ